MSARGEPVLHVYLIFIACCLIYGSWSLYKYVVYLEDTVEQQNEAIQMQRIESETLKQYINRMHQIQSPTYQNQYQAFPKKI